MKFQLAINLERITPDTDMNKVRDHTLEMVKMADAAGFEIAMGGRTSRHGNDHRT